MHKAILTTFDRGKTDRNCKPFCFCCIWMNEFLNTDLDGERLYSDFDEEQNFAVYSQTYGFFFHSTQTVVIIT